MDHAVRPRPVVLMIEDNDGVRALIGAQLAPDYDFHGAGTGEEGLRLARAQPPDVILLDLSLPGQLQGVDVLDALAREPDLASVPVIVVTGSDDPDTLAGTLARGAHDFLGKPYQGVELQARVAVAVRTKRLHDGLRIANARLAQEALTDALTGLANRRHGISELERLTAYSRRHGEQFSVMHADIDRFKEINDHFGHAVGDTVLCAVGARFSSALRREDLLVRWGGDEFVAMLPHAGPQDAATVAERLRIAASHEPVVASAVAVTCTVSLGWACAQGEAPDALLARADDALYEAKRSGRDAIFPPLGHD